jgi:hypothetical protein
MDTATLVVITLIVTVLVLAAWMGIEHWYFRRKRTKHAH